MTALDELTVTLRVEVSKGQHRALCGPFFMALTDETSSAYLALHEAARQTPFPRPIEVGDRVYDEDMDEDGTVLAIDGGEAWVGFGPLLGRRNRPLVRLARIEGNHA